MSEIYERFTTGGVENQVFGPDIDSDTIVSNTASVTHRYHRVSGTGEIDTINPPWPGFIGEVVLLPLAAFTLGTSGNITTAITAGVDVPLVLHYNGTDWLPLTGFANTVGNLTGDVTGNLTGNVTGDVTGDLTGNVIGGAVGAATFTLNDLNTAPASAAATGTKGMIRFAAAAIYLCIDTDTWVKADLATWT